jgi:predicted permease
VLSDTLWRTSFGADSGVVGRTIQINGQAMTIAGIAAREFRGSIVGLSIDIFLPIKMYTEVMQNDTLWFRNNQLVMAFMLLPTRAARDQARAQAAIVSTALADAHAIDHLSERAIVVPVWEWPFGAQSFLLPAVGLMSAMSALLLVVVCANVAGLVLVRSMARRGEIAARLALGASRLRIVRQLMIESFVLAIPAAGIGLLLPRLAEPFIGAAVPNVVVPLFFNVEPDRFVIGFTLLVAWLSAFIYGLVPAMQLSRMDLASVLKDDLSPLGRSRGSLRTTLVVMQVALSLILLIGTGLVLRSLDAIKRADPGFAADQVTWATFDVRASGLSVQGGQQFYRRLLEAVGDDERIDSASVAAYLPLTMIDWQSWNVKPEGYASRRDENLTAAVNVVGPEYFQTLGIPLVTGREFAIRDEEPAERVAIINETFARRFWGSPREAIGKRFEGGGHWRTVVGVARDAKYARLDEARRPYVYVPFGQSYGASMTLEVRARGSSGDVLDRIRAHAASINPEMPIVDSGLLADQIRSAVSILETIARVLGMIGTLTIGLVALGIYGLVAYTVKQSAHEIGIRTALGARPSDITRRFIASGARLGIVGVVLGTIAAFAVTRLMAQLLYGVSATDPMSFTMASVLVLSVAVGASLIPAWRASRGSPLRALRHQ